MNKQSFLGDNLDDILKSKVIGIIGIGGGGSHLIQQLAHIGFENFVVCDPDIIEKSNLTRHVLARAEDVKAKKSKVDLAKEKVLSLNPGASIRLVKSKWQDGAGSGSFDNCDILICAMDSIDERDQVERFSRELKIPYLDIGMYIKKTSDDFFYIFGQVIMTFPGKPCLRCLDFLREETLDLEAGHYGDAGNRPQVIWPNGVLASTAIGVLMDYFFNWSGNNLEYVYLQYNGNEHTITGNEHAKHLVEASSGKCEHFG